jgi:hypothetical protein
MDERRTMSYLETDKFENVRFYQKFGFTVITEAEVLGTPNWFMSRAPRTVVPSIAHGIGQPWISRSAALPQGTGR